TRRRLSAALFVICIDFAAMPVHAQLAPSQPIKIIVGVPAGGLGGLAGRILPQRRSEQGDPALVENRRGGNGINATHAVVNSRADGYTLIMGNQREQLDMAGQVQTQNPCIVSIPSAYLARCPAVSRTRADTPRQAIL